MSEMLKFLLYLWGIETWRRYRMGKNAPQNFYSTYEALKQ